MTEKELWHEYCQKNDVDENTPCTAWSFGGEPDMLAELVCRGIKTATCAWYDLYKLASDGAEPKPGDLSIILNAASEAVCIIRNTKVYITGFSDVTEEHAYKEGEGDRSLSYWRQVHKDFFTGIAEVYGLTFNEDIRLLCMEFEVIYKH